MKLNYIIAVCVTLVSLVVLVGNFSLPALTTDTSSTAGEAVSARFERMVVQEFSFCQSLGPEVDCACFAERSTIVMMNETPRIRGVVYPAKSELARGQAELDC